MRRVSRDLLLRQYTTQYFIQVMVDPVQCTACIIYPVADRCRLFSVQRIE